jgi:hypothetical protein
MDSKGKGQKTKKKKRHGFCLFPLPFLLCIPGHFLVFCSMDDTKRTTMALCNDDDCKGWRVEGYYRKKADDATSPYPFPQALAKPWEGQEAFVAALEKLQPKESSKVRKVEDLSELDGIVCIAFRGLSPNRLVATPPYKADSTQEGPEAPKDMGCREYWDLKHKVVWTEGLQSYVTLYNVKPSDEFVKYVDARVQDTLDHDATHRAADAIHDRLWEETKAMLRAPFGAHYKPVVTPKGIHYTCETRKQEMVITQKPGANKDNPSVDLTLNASLCLERWRYKGAPLLAQDLKPQWEERYAEVCEGAKAMSMSVSPEFRINYCPIPCKAHESLPLGTWTNGRILHNGGELFKPAATEEAADPPTKRARAD